MDLLIFLKLMIDMDARGNKLHAKFQINILKNKKMLLNFQNSGNFGLTRKMKKKRNKECCYTTLKKLLRSQAFSC